jgi:hypothetical protein
MNVTPAGWYISADGDSFAWWDGSAWGHAWPSSGAPPMPLDFVSTADPAAPKRR